VGGGHPAPPDQRLVEVRSPDDLADAARAALFGRGVALSSPAPGPFAPGSGPRVVTTEGELIRAGDVVGYVGGVPLRAEVTGWLVDVAVSRGEHVVPGQLVARVEPI
jgi:biotin carboxyl carrier protein